MLRRHPFQRACERHGIEHRLTKPNHPWTNGQVERMNRTLKEATVQRYHYENHEQLRQHLADFLVAYNFAKRLKALRGLTPYESHSGCLTPPPSPRSAAQHPLATRARRTCATDPAPSPGWGGTGKRVAPGRSCAQNPKGCLDRPPFACNGWTALAPEASNRLRMHPSASVKSPRLNAASLKKAALEAFTYQKSRQLGS